MESVLAWSAPGRHLIKDPARNTPFASSRRLALSILGIAFSFLATDTRAAEFSRAVTVSSTLFQGASRPASPTAQNYVFVVVNSAAWGTSSCRQDAVAIKKEDNHLIAQLLYALATGNAITLFVDDTLRPVDSVICQVVVIQVNQ